MFGTGRKDSYALRRLITLKKCFDDLTHHLTNQKMTDFRNNRNGLSRTEERLDSENQRRVDGLSDKVSRLKSLAFDIETETKDSNKYLDDMGNDFESTQGLLGGTVNRLSHMVNANKGNRKLMCYLIIGLILFFFLTYYLITKVTG